MATNQADFLRTGLRKVEACDTRLTDTECTICLEAFQLEEEFREIRVCGHAFHERCLLSWFNSQNPQHSSCPICRKKLFPARYPSTVARIVQLMEELEQLRVARNDVEQTRTRLEEERRQSRAEAPDINRYLTRAMRAQDGTDPLPACILSDPVTGEYTTVETRYRAYWEEYLRAGGSSSNNVQAMVEVCWNSRSNFVRDLARLEHIHLRLDPSSVASDIRVLSTQQHIEYGSLLEKLMPNNVNLDTNTSEIIEGMNNSLHFEARRFSLLSPAEEERHRKSAEESWDSMAAMYTVERRRSLVEGLLQRYRLSRFVDSGVYRHYMDATDGPVGLTRSSQPVGNQMAGRVGSVQKHLEM